MKCKYSGKPNGVTAMLSKQVPVSGSEFRVGANVLVRDVKTRGKVRWRQRQTQVQLKTPVDETVTVLYDRVRWIHCAAIQPL